MPRPKGLPKTGGRPPGAVNKVTAEVKSLAREYGADVIARLAAIALKSENEVAAISAGKELLDRGYGKALTMVSGPNEGPIDLKATHRFDTSKLTVEQLRALASIEV